MIPGRGRCGAIARAVLAALVLGATFGSLAAASDRLDVGAGVPLADALRSLREAGLRIVYSSELVRPEMRVERAPRSRWPREILDEILAPHGLRAEAGPGGVIRVVPAPVSGTLEGEVRRGGGEELLAGARVVVEGTGVEAVSGPDGRFRADRVPPGTHDVVAALPGYAPRRIRDVPVGTDRPTRLRFELDRREAAPERVVVRAAEGSTARDRVEMRQELDGEVLREIPGPVADPLRAVAALPGAVAEDGAAAFRMRGGETGDVAMTVDGIEIQDPFHMQDLGGVTSILDPQLVGGVSVMRSAYPAEYGGRMGGVVEFDTVRPEGLSNGLGISSNGVRFATQGTTGGGEGRWLVSARRGTPSPLLEDLGADPVYRPVYYDALATFRWQAGERTELSFHLLSAHDDVEGGDETYIQTTDEPGTFRSRYTNDYAWAKAETTWRPGLVSRTVVSVGSQGRRRLGSNPSSLDVRDVRSSSLTGLRQDWVLRAGRHAWKWGVDVDHASADYDYTLDPVAGGDPRHVTLRPSGVDTALYFADRVTLDPKTTLEAGLRFEMQTFRPTTDRRVSPRVNFARDLGAAGTLRLGWGYFYQPQRIYELQVEDGVDRFGPPERAEHRAVEWTRPFSNAMRLTVGAYENRMTDLRPRYENLFGAYGFFPENRPDRVMIAPDGARARGVELTLEGPPGRKTAWWAGYTLASAVEYENGRRIWRDGDQRHTLSFGANRRLASRWSVAVGGTFHTGRPSTPLDVAVETGTDGNPSAVPGPRNGDRLPDYLRLDVGLRRAFTFNGQRLQVYVDLTNVLGRDNACCVRGYDLDASADGTPTARRDFQPGFPRTLTFGLDWTF